MIIVKERIDEKTIEDLAEERRYLAGLVYEVSFAVRNYYATGCIDVQPMNIVLNEILAKFNRDLPPDLINAEDVLRERK